MRHESFMKVLSFKLGFILPEIMLGFCVVNQMLQVCFYALTVGNSN